MKSSSLRTSALASLAALGAWSSARPGPLPLDAVNDGGSAALTTARGRASRPSQAKLRRLARRRGSR